MRHVGLIDEDLKRLAPSIFSNAPHPEVSGRYGFVPTISIIETLRERGLVPVSARQSRKRLPDRRLFALHEVRLRPEYAELQVGDIFPEVVLTNSHDRSSAYHLHGGLYRLWCNNGAATPIGEHGGFSARHQGDVFAEVLEATEKTVEHLPQITSRVAEFVKIDLPLPKQIEFAERAALLRWEKPLVGPERLNQARRTQDVGDSLWLTFNRVQENIVRGGLEYERTDPKTNRLRRFQTRPIRSIDADIEFNRALWQLAEEYAAQ